MQRRETIHISLGSSANAVTAHLLNLQGLAATGPGAPCDPNVTHSIGRASSSNHSSANEVWVPRVLFVDEPANFRYITSSDQQASANTTVPTWSGSIEHISPLNGLAVVGNHDTTEQPPHPFDLFHQQASILAYSSHSRYQAPPSSSKYSRLDNAVSRHVNWDDMDDNDDDENEEEREFRARRERQQWQHNTELPIQEQLTSFRETTLPVSSPQKPEPSPTQEEKTDRVESHIPWRMFWMPPYPTQFAVPLPVSSWTSADDFAGSVVETWDTFLGSREWNSWKEDELREQLRRVLEDCDSLQGVTVMTQGHGVYAGLATEVLQELQEECRTAGRLVIHVADDNDSDSNDNTSSSPDRQAVDKENAPPSLSTAISSPSWQLAQRDRARNMLQRALALHGLASHANVVLPVSLRNHSNLPLFAASAKLALALETATLPYRLDASDSSCSSLYPSQIGLNSYYTGNLTGDFPFGTASALSFGEYLACLQPSQQHQLIELDACTSPVDHFAQVLQAGTSLEQDARMRQPSAFSQRSVLGPPGAWIQNDTNKGGILTSFSPAHGFRAADRSLHHHFAMATSLRPADDNEFIQSPSQDMALPMVSQHVKSLMESMGISYRPEVSVASVLEQSAGRLTSGGYGAGSYWHSTLWNKTPQPPVLTLLGNTSRVYPRLYSIAKDAKEVLSSIRYRGFYNRDVQSGVLPEREDSEEAIAFCLDLRDLYHPPEGSGLGMDIEDGE